MLQEAIGNKPRGTVQYVGKSESQPYELVIDGNEDLFYSCRFNLQLNLRNDDESKRKYVLTDFDCKKYSKPVEYQAVEYTLTMNYIVAVASAPYLDIEGDDTSSGKYKRQFFMLVWDKYEFKETLQEDKQKKSELVGYTYRVEKLCFGILQPNILANEFDPENPDSSKLSDVVSILEKSGEVRTIRLGRSAKVIKTNEKKLAGSTLTNHSTEQEILNTEVRFLGNFWARNTQVWKLSELFSPSTSQLQERKMMEQAFLIGLGVLTIIMSFYCCHLFSVTKMINREKAIQMQIRKKMIKVDRPNHLSVIEEFEREDQDESY